MSPALRKSLLTAHVASSVAWLGAVAAFLALALLGLASPDVDTVHAADVSLALIARAVIIPLCLASGLTGIVQSLATPWGLFRHHWLIAKLFITLVSSLVLWLHLSPIAELGASAAAQAMSPHLHALRVQMAVDSGAALFALLVATGLGVFKPKGTTRLATRRPLVNAA